MHKNTKELRTMIARLDRIVEEYKTETPKRERDYKGYEENFLQRLKHAFNELSPLVKEAISCVKNFSGEKRGNEHILSLEQRLMMILLQRICFKSNRTMSCMMTLFLWFTGIDLSYKTIERLYSDVDVRIALFNMHVLLLRKKGIENVNCAGDGTGYTVLINEHYASEAKKRREKAKENIDTKERKHNFIYSFAIMDIKSRMYVGYGTSLKSEREAFENALVIAKDVPVNVLTFRLDRYYSGESYVNLCEKYLGKTKMFIIPKKNIAHFGLGEWCSMLHRFLGDIKAFLKDYFQRNQSESGFSEDKKRTGWRIPQKRSDRVDTAYTLDIIWHNLFWGCPDV
jgi:transposase